MKIWVLDSWNQANQILTYDLQIRSNWVSSYLITTVLKKVQQTFDKPPPNIPEKEPFNVDEVKGVNYVNKNLTFPFDELTNFQASKLENGPINKQGNWNATGPFYSVGTLAYFMKCRGLKHISYVRWETK